MTIQHTVTGDGNLQVRADKTKNLSSFRTLPLLPSLEAHLRKVQAYQAKMKELFGREYIDEGYICTREDGRLISPAYLTNAFYKACERIGLECICFHDLRHSAASTLLANGFSLKEVSEFLGHCDIGTTGNIYGHLQYQCKVNMANQMDELLLK